MNMKLSSGLNKQITINRRITRYFIIIVAIIGSIAWFSFCNMRFYNEKYKAITDNYVILNNISNDMKLAEKHLYRYIYIYGNGNEVNLFFNEIDEIQYNLDHITLLSNDLEEFILVKNMKNKLISCREVADAVIKANYNFKTEAVIEYMGEVNNISLYIDDDVKKLMTLLLTKNEVIYKNITSNSDSIYGITIMTIIGTIILGILFSILVSESITKPLSDFAGSAENISKGDFDVQLSYSPYIEINRLIDVFKRMSADIQSYITEIHWKVYVEKKLKEQQLENLKISNLLRETKFQTLQSKINPHFLFNTLNIISRKAILEKSYETSDLINSLSKLMRYSLSNLDAAVELKDELEIIKEYLAIQEARFGKRIKVQLYFDKEILKIKIPCLILQPLVENAFKYGIEDMEQGGEIIIYGFKNGDLASMIIYDNGNGVKPEILKEILDDDSSYTTSNIKGIGIRNVKSRLELFYNKKGIFDIRSIYGEGTEVILNLPINIGSEALCTEC